MMLLLLFFVFLDKQMPLLLQVMPLHTFDWKPREALVHYLTGACFSYYTGVFVQLIRLKAVDQIFKTKLVTGDFLKWLFINPQEPATK